MLLLAEIIVFIGEFLGIWILANLVRDLIHVKNDLRDMISNARIDMADIIAAAQDK